MWDSKDGHAAVITTPWRLNAGHWALWHRMCTLAPVPANPPGLHVPPSPHQTSSFRFFVSWPKWMCSSVMKNVSAHCRAHVSSWLTALRKKPGLQVFLSFCHFPTSALIYTQAHHERQETSWTVTTIIQGQYRSIPVRDPLFCTSGSVSMMKIFWRSIVQQYA